jgi:hypothetical protein
MNTMSNVESNFRKTVYGFNLYIQTEYHKSTREPTILTLPTTLKDYMTLYKLLDTTDSQKIM